LQISFSGQTIAVEVAQTQEEHRQGLIGRTELSDSEGMLFIYEKAHILSFWMKGMKIPLSVGFFDERRALIGIEEMALPKEGETFKRYRSKRPAIYALEMPAGWFQRHGVSLGMRFEILDSSFPAQ